MLTKINLKNCWHWRRLENTRLRVTVMTFSSFTSFEFEGWEKSVEGYDSLFGDLTKQPVDRVLELANVEKGADLLDLASGPGYLASRAHQIGARVIATDFSPEMIAKGEAKFPDIRFEIADAQNLSQFDRSFDVVTMNFGILHLEHPEVAIQQACSVLRASGVFVFTTWERPEVSKGFEIALEAIARHGSKELEIPLGPDFFLFSNRDHAVHAGLEAGFKEVTCYTFDSTWDLSEPAEVFDAFISGTARTGGLLRAQPEENLAQIKFAMHEMSKKYVKDGRVRIPMRVLIYVGKK